MTPLMQQYWSIKSEYTGIILFFRLGDFYEMFGDDAVKASPVMEVVLTQRAGMPMCGVPHHSVNTYIRKLINKGHKVAVCEQIEEAGASKGIVKRSVAKVITPGTVLEDTLLESKKNNYLMSVYFDENTFSGAFAAADISTGDFFVSECSLKTLESEISKYNPGEIVINSKNLLNPYIAQYVEKLKIPVSEVEEKYFDFPSGMQKIQKTFGPNSVKSFGLDKKEIVSACAAVLNYIAETQPQSVGIFSSINHLRNTDFMCLDGTAIRNLELLYSMSSGKTENSLLSVMDGTKTPMGARTLRQWLIKPLIDTVKIKERQKKVGFFIEDSIIRKEIREKLKNVSDIERIAARISSSSANPREISALKDSLRVINGIAAILNSDEKLNALKDKNDIIIKKIEDTLVEEPSVSLKDGNVIKSSVSAVLDELRRLSTDTKTYISNLETKERQNSAINNLKIGYTSIFGYYIEISKANIPLAPKHYIRKQTLANCERYITEELKELESKILSSQEKILRLESELFNILRQELATCCNDILKTSHAVAEIDIFCGFAQNALDYNYTCPEINDGTDLNIQEGRHPVVERILKSGEFVANDTDFKCESSRIMILTGPNMSGKSTYLRQNALIAIMAQVGSYVPAKAATIGVIDRIFTRIGAGDNLAGGESTFMVEMTETANILNQYTFRSLIILDEVGRGTSTYDGMSIAWAVIEYFADEKREANLGAKVLFATHYFELTELSKKYKSVINFSVDVKEWNGDVVFLHKIKEGSADRSYGIHVAKIAGIPHKVIERANSVLRELEKKRVEPSKLNESAQIEFFCAAEPQILIELKKLDIDNMSPMEAFKILSEWKEKYK
ncbi:MAG: DNA mismatch repair protein MutS [Endomicrobium sp.]|jgi:DNA mismatch repair protein MutS|nr:DNA mismatch repair protein MutS [Endomicrobium sp.]